MSKTLDGILTGLCPMSLTLIEIASFLRMTCALSYNAGCVLLISDFYFYRACQAGFEEPGVLAIMALGGVG
ncbi:MAG: hypothetical protein LBS80_01880, partial [Tannerella sp.]|nr:hypothetical protein [Tannerella sp.]